MGLWDVSCVGGFGCRCRLRNRGTWKEAVPSENLFCVARLGWVLQSVERTCALVPGLVARADLGTGEPRGSCAISEPLLCCQVWAGFCKILRFVGCGAGFACRCRLRNGGTWR